jgi:4-amino-4-deoxy-L-arabinose transferase-like glycosyltransferase
LYLNKERRRESQSTFFTEDNTLPHNPYDVEVTQPTSVRPPAITQPVSSEGFTEAIQNMLTAPERESQTYITGQHVLMVGLLVVVFFIRITNLNFNTLYLDEAIYATVGEDVLAGVFDKGATQWMFGSYLYPVAATLADRIGGEFGIRALSVILSTTAAFFIYLAARRMFGSSAALWALLFFGLSGASISLGQHATYDAMGVPFLAATLFCAASAIWNPKKQKRYLTWAGITFSLSVLSKYIGITFLPALLMVMLVFHLYQGRGLFSFVTQISWVSFFVPMALILGIYGAFYHQDLQLALSGQFASQPEDRLVILNEIVQDIGVPTIFALIGLLIGAGHTALRLRRQKWDILVLLGLSVPWLLLAISVLPIYHLVTSNVRALWKDNVYTLVFLAPLAGLGVAKLLEYGHSVTKERAVIFRLVSAVLTAAAIFFFVSSGLARNAGFHFSWPNNQPILAFMRQQGVTPESRVLASGYAIYEYYFDFGTNDRDVWSNVWYTEHNGLTGTEAVAQAVRDCAYDMIVLDNYYAPEWAGTLQAMMADAGYVVVFNHVETLSTGIDVTTYVNVPSADGACQRRLQ